MKQRDTAITVFREDIQPTLCRRQIFVRAQLRAFIERHGLEPTALELVRFIAAAYPQEFVDVNTVRPRLHELVQGGYVEACDRRPCTISKKRVYTWRPCQPKPPTLDPVPQRLQF